MLKNIICVTCEVFITDLKSSSNNDADNKKAGQLMANWYPNIVFVFVFIATMQQKNHNITNDKQNCWTSKDIFFL